MQMTFVWIIFIIVALQDCLIYSHTTHDTTLPICVTSQLTFGHWEEDYVAPPARNSCGLLTEYLQPLREQNSDYYMHGNEWSRYCWKPHGCHMHPFSVQLYCEVFANHNLFIIGDSTSYEFYQALFMQLELPGEPKKQHDLDEEIVVCDGKSKIKYVRNDVLSSIIEDDWNSRLGGYDIILINKGSHIHEVEEYEKFVEVTTESAIALGTYINGSTSRYLIFRTTSQPHPYCSLTDTADTRDVLSYDDVRYVEYDETSPFNQHEWYKIPSRDRHSIEIYKKHVPTMTVLDVAPMTSVRKDGHRAPGDCLHYFMPSVVDNWVGMFLHHMIEILSLDPDLVKSVELQAAQKNYYFPWRTMLLVVLFVAVITALVTFFFHCVSILKY